ncbi:class A beta-lactamase [Aquabacter sp. CN5-332]|uniref:class A beta-lactamase n=1 Tax=Aquabacter sp. CN5-332 TaxID=3156608 RepID=UPI0032B4D40A
MIGRRQFAALLPVGAALLLRPGYAAASGPLALPADRLAAIEARTGGRLGVAVIDTANDARAGYRADERFPMCSTFKVLASAAVLSRVDAGKETLDRRIRYDKADLVTYSPATEKHVSDGMTLAELCAAAITLSDNTAGNLLLANIGGPEGLTAYARLIGDPVSRLDRIETALNEAAPGDPHDTTTPAAMAANLRRLVLGDALSAASRKQLTDWLLANTTGDTRLRAGLPGWRVGDKTGTGENGTYNDVGIAWPTGRPPVIIAVYLTTAKAPLADSNAAIAEVARVVAGTLGG